MRFFKRHFYYMQESGQSVQKTKKFKYFFKKTFYFFLNDCLLMCFMFSIF